MLKRADSLSRGRSLGRSFGPGASLPRSNVTINVAEPVTDTQESPEALPAPPPTKRGLGALGSFASKLWSGRQENRLGHANLPSQNQLIEQGPSLVTTEFSKLPPTNSSSGPSGSFRDANNALEDRIHRVEGDKIKNRSFNGLVNGSIEDSKSPASVENLMQQLAHMSLTSDQNGGLPEPPRHTNMLEDEAEDDIPRGPLLRATGQSVSRSSNSSQRNGSRTRHLRSASSGAQSSSIRDAPAWTTSAAAILTGGRPLHEVQGYSSSGEAYKARIDLLAMPAENRKIAIKRADSGKQGSVFSRDRGETAAGTARRTLLLERTHNALRRKQERGHLPPRSPVVKAPPTQDHEDMLEPPKVTFASALNLMFTRLYMHLFLRICS